jgi:hypothetical protein
MTHVPKHSRYLGRLLMEHWIELAKHIASTVDRDRAHISLIVRKNRLLAVGTNNWKTHPKTAEYGYMYPYLHSELDAFRKIKIPQDKLVLYNFRFSKTGRLGMSKPCKFCMPWCSHVFDRIIYSNEEGKIVNDIQ